MRKKRKTESLTPDEMEFYRRTTSCGESQIAAFVDVFYRQHGKKPPDLPERHLRVKACRLKTYILGKMRSSDALLYVDKNGEQRDAKSEIVQSVKQLADELEEARKQAIDTVKPAAAVAAVMGKAKLFGLLVDRQEVRSTVNQIQLYETEQARKMASFLAGGVSAN